MTDEGPKVDKFTALAGEVGWCQAEIKKLKKENRSIPKKLDEVLARIEKVSESLELKQELIERVKNLEAMLDAGGTIN